MRIKGQNLRAYAAGVAVPEETNLNVTITGNSEDTTTKDTEGMGTRETIVSRSWQMKVDTYDAQPESIASLVDTFNSALPIGVAFSHTGRKAGTFNRVPHYTQLTRKGTALLSDLTLLFNNRQTVSVSMQYTGTGELAETSTQLAAGTKAPSPDDLQKGEKIRLFLSMQKDKEKVIAAATEMQLHLSAQTEDATTKDDTGAWNISEVTGLSYDLTGSALILTNEDELADEAFTVLDTIKANRDETIYWKICSVGGKNNRTVEKQLFHGEAKLTQLELNGQNKQNATYKYTLSGVGVVSVDIALPVFEVFADQECTAKPANNKAYEEIYIKILKNFSQEEHYEYNGATDGGKAIIGYDEADETFYANLWIDFSSTANRKTPYTAGEVIPVRFSGGTIVSGFNTIFHTDGTSDTPVL